MVLTPVLDQQVFSSDEMLIKIAGYFSKEPGTALLYSGSAYDSAQLSFLALFPYEVLQIKSGIFTHSEAGRVVLQENVSQNPWDLLKQYIGAKKEGSSLPEWIGYLGYEMGAFSDLECLSPCHQSEYADAYFQRSALLFVYEKASKSLSVAVDTHGISKISSINRKWISLLTNEESLLEFLKGLEQSPVHTPVSGECEVLKPLDSYETYARKVERAKEYIAAGDIYQVNLSHKIRYKSQVDPFNVYQNLNRVNPAPFSAYLAVTEEHQIVSSSPERLLQLKEGRLETRPIKGTMKRGKSAEEDAHNKQILLNSEKDKAELLMITDLMRNDLGRVSLSGSVKVEQLRTCEAYTNVFHMLSVISSRANPEIHPVDLLRASFPGGSITGCPKLRSMEVISEIENSYRGIYTGSIGYFSGNGDFDFNIAIRTLNFLSGVITAQVGGAIVYDSDAQQEYAETLVKGESLFKSINLCVHKFP